MFWKLHRCPDLQDAFPALETAKFYIDCAIKNRKKRVRVAFLSGNAGTYALSAVINKELNRFDEVKTDLKIFSRGINICSQTDYDGGDGGDEFLCGRAGYIAGIYFLNSNIEPKPFSNDIISNLCSVMLESGRQYATAHKSGIPLMYQYHGSEYLGAAHGLCSILWVLLESPMFEKKNGQFPSISQSNLKDVKGSIDKFLTLQDPHGMFPTRWNTREKKLVHWCHGKNILRLVRIYIFFLILFICIFIGAPGAIYLFAKAYLVFGEEKYLKACQRCAEGIWNSGLLCKGPSICHGIAGNGYAFLLMYRLTKEPKYMYRAKKFMRFLTEQEFLDDARTPDRPYSLFEGISGTVCFLIDLLDVENAAFPFMDVHTKKYD